MKNLNYFYTNLLLSFTLRIKNQLIKQLLVGVFFLFCFQSSMAQIIGGRSNGEMSPKIAQPSTLSGGSFSGDVNNMTGQYQASVPLGTVATPGGLSFTLSLDHSSSFGFSTNQPSSSGIPYGEGWNLSLPSISVETDIFNAYISACLENGACDGQTIDPNDPSYVNNYRKWDGKLFWFSPTINIPGVGGGSAIFKYIDTDDDDCAVFVLNKFETPIEIRFYGTSWEARLADGTVYSFSKSIQTYRAPSNKRTFYYDCTSPGPNFNAQDPAHSALVGDPDDFVSGESILSQIEPNADFGTWYCDRIYNKNIPLQNIIFTYETFGQFNYFKEFLQPSYSLVHDVVFNDGAYLPDFKGSSDIYLTKIESWVADFTPLDILELDYKTLNGAYNGSQIILDPNGVGVERLDSLYSYKVIKSGTDGALFTDWNRYKHKNNVISGNIDPYISSTNPYLNSSASYSVQQNSQSNQVIFNHSFLESPRINLNGVGAGDIFEIRTKVTSASQPLMNGNGTIDIAVVTAKTDDNVASYITPSSTYSSSSYQASRGTEIFSTFNMGMKWTKSVGQALETSNYFMMPNLPSDFLGFNVQVGPGNSEIDYAYADYVNNKHSFTGETEYYPNALTGYPQLFGNSTNNSSSTIGHNFGIGLPWGMMAPVYNTMVLSTVSSLTNFELLYLGIGCLPTTDANFPSGYSNPTKFNDKTQLTKFELIRYSKNAYMLQGVRQYKVNGTIGTYVSEGKKLVAQKKIDYESILESTTLKNLNYQNGEPNKPLEFESRGRVTFLLTKIHDIPVEGDLYAVNFGLSHPEEVLTTTLEYTNVLPDLASTGGIYNSQKPYQGLTHYAITKYTDHLGGVTSIEYYAVDNAVTRIQENISIKNSCPGESLASITPSYGAGSSYTMHLAVKYISKIAENYNISTSNFYQPVRKWEYVYDLNQRIYNTKNADIPGNYFKGQYMFSFDQAFGKVTVYSPALDNGARNYTVYEYEGKRGYPFNVELFATQSEYLLYGKLRSVRSYDNNNILHEETLYNYSYTLAAIDGFYRPNFYKTGIDYYDHLLLRDYEYEDYYKNELYSCANPLYPQNNSLPEFLYGEEAKMALTPVKFDYSNIKFLPYFLHNELRSTFYHISSPGSASGATIPGNPDYLLNSYFIKKTSETHRVYENGLTKANKGTVTPVFPISVTISSDPSGPIIVNPVVYDSNNDPTRIYAIHNDYDQAISGLLADSLLSDSVLLHLCNETGIATENKLLVLLSQNQLSTKVWQAIIDNYKYFAPNELSQLVNMQPYFSDQLQDYLMYMMRPNAFPGSRIPFPSQFFEQIMLKNPLLSDGIIDKFVQASYSFPGKSFENIMSKQNRQLKEVLLNTLINSDNITNSNVLEVMAYQEMSDKQFMDLIDIVGLDVEVMTQLFEKVNVLPTDNVIDYYFEHYHPSVELMQRTVDRIDWELNATLKNKIINYYGTLSSTIQFPVEYNILSKYCPSAVTTNRTFIETKQEFQYYEADYRGKAIGKPFELLLGMISSIDEPSVFPKQLNYTSYLFNLSRTIPSLQLKHEPSWQLFSVKTTSPHLTGAASSEQYFYLYDLQNKYDRIWYNYDLEIADISIYFQENSPLDTDTLGFIYSWGDDYLNYIPIIPDFDGMSRARSSNLKTHAFQKTTISKNNTDAKAMRISEYYNYDARWEFDDLFSGSPIVETFAGASCPPPTTSACDQCVVYNHIFNHNDLISILSLYPGYCAWEIGYDLEGGYPYDYKFCPSEINPNSCDNVFNYWNAACQETTSPDPPGGSSGLPVLSKALSETLQLRSVTIQVDTIAISDDFEAYKMDGNNDYIAEFKLTEPFTNNPNGFEGNYSMILPFTNLTVRTIDERNRHLQPALEHNQLELQTKYYYSRAQRTQHVNTNCASDQYQTITNANIGLPIRITVGFERSDSLSTAYVYTDAGMASKVTEPSGKYSEYTFDGFQRLSQTSQNDERILADYSYHYWSQNTALNFQGRTQENYVYSKLYNSASAGDLEMRRAYMDPLGRAQAVITSYESAPSIMTHIYSGNTIYDNWDRSIRQFKNYVISDDYSSIPSAYFPASTFNFMLPYSDTYYENTPKNRANRIANFGVDITNPQDHVVRTKYDIANNVFTSCELDLTSSELTAIMGSGNTSSCRFFRTSILDQDSKQTVEYTNALGQKIATLKYNDNNEKIVTLFIYDSYGNLTKVINPKKQQSTYDYNILGQLVKETTVDAGVRKYMYNKQGLVSATLDQQSWNHKNVLEEKDPFYRVYTYDIYGRILSVGRSAGPVNYVNYQTYGPLHYKTEVVNGSQVFDYDDQAQPLNWSYLDYVYTNSSTQDWLAHYKAVKVLEDEGSLYPEIFEVNNLASAFSIFALEKETIYGTNTTLTATGKVIATRSYNNDGACVQFISYDYDNYDNLNAQVIKANPDQTVGTTETWPLESEIGYYYNYRGALLTEWVDSNNDGNIDMVYFNSYDPLNRLTGIYAASSAVSSKANATLLVSYEHDDANGLVLKKTHSVSYNGVNTDFVDIDYTYDVRDRLTSINAINRWDNSAPSMFNYQLFYDAQTPYYNFDQTNALTFNTNWNGNINGSLTAYDYTYATDIPANMQEPLLYGYRYDKLNRLLNADAMVGDIISIATSGQTNESYTVGDANYYYDKIGNIQFLNRNVISQLPGEVLDEEGFIYQYQSSTNRLLNALGSAGTGTPNRTYTYDENGNVLSDTYREIHATDYGRAAYAFHISQDDKEISYLYSIDDQRMFKEVITSTETKREYYLSDAMGHVVGLRTEVTPTGLPTQTQWEYYAHGAEREARLVNTDSNPTFDADEVSFFLYDHLGNTRLNYTPKIELIPTIDEEVFNNNFASSLYDWQALDANTSLTLAGGTLVAQNTTGSAVAVKPGVSFEYGHSYTLTIAATEVNVASIDVVINNVTIGTIQNSGMVDVYTFVAPSTGIYDLRIEGNGLAPNATNSTRKFYVKSISLEDQTPAHVEYTYIINYAGDYFPYGKVLREYTNSNGQERYLTTQHERDAETGLDYRGARYYDSDVARFLSIDPWQKKYPAFSTYNYVMGNPIMLTDPTGKGSEKIEPLNKEADAMVMSMVDKYAQVLKIDPPKDGVYSANSSLYSNQKQLKSAMKDLKMNTSDESVQEAWNFYQALSDSKIIEVTATATAEEAIDYTLSEGGGTQGSKTVNKSIGTSNSEYDKFISSVQEAGVLTQTIANDLYGRSPDSGKITPDQTGDGWAYFSNRVKTATNASYKGHILIDITNSKEPFNYEAQKLIKAIPSVNP